MANLALPVGHGPQVGLAAEMFLMAGRAFHGGMRHVGGTGFAGQAQEQVGNFLRGWSRAHPFKFIRELTVGRKRIVAEIMTVQAQFAFHRVAARQR
jgi:hypothetical protein